MSQRRPSPVDPGLQPERTALAHLRTGLTTAAIGALIIRQAHAGGERVLTVTVTVLAVTAAVAAAWWRHHLIVHGDHRVTTVAMAVISAAVLVLQAAGLVLILRV